MIKEWFKQLGRSQKSIDHSIKILIIEDSPVDAKISQKAVDICGFEYLLATDGKTGIAMAIEHKPNLIVLDYHLPDLNGAEIMEYLRANEATDSITVIILTSENEPEAIIDTFMQGADQFFKKPISAPFLAKEIKVMLKETHKK